MKKFVMAFFIICLCFPTYAQGTSYPGPSRAETLLIAERWIAAQGLNNPCISKLAINVVDNPHIDGVPVRGFANGWRGQEWDPTICKITIASDMNLIGECETIAHEYMHMVRGPEHTGPLGWESHEATECQIDRRSIRRILYDTVRETLPTGISWQVRCGKKYCIATSLRARYSRSIRFSFQANGLVIGKWIIKRSSNNRKENQWR